MGDSPYTDVLWEGPTTPSGPAGSYLSAPLPGIPPGTEVVVFHKAMAVAENPRVLPQNEATELTRPADHNTPWRWSDPIDAIVGDSGKWDQWPEFSDADGWWPVRVAQSAIENLYRAGFALVRVPGPSNATDTQETNHAR